MDPWTIATVVGPWLTKIPDMISNELNTRGTIRVKREEARLTIQVEERRAALAQSLVREQHQHSMALQYLAIHAQHYPLGVPGRFRDSGSRQRPVVLVSPPPGGLLSPFRGTAAGRPGVDELTYDRLQDAPEIRRYADLLTGAFASDEGVPRAIRGVGEAQEIAIAEFPSHPAILIYFERHASGLTAFAYLARLFATVDRDYGFPVRVAKFVTDGNPAEPPIAVPLDTDLPTWQLIDISGWKGPRDEVVAAVISLFTLAALDSYWLLQGVTGTGLLASAFAREQGTDASRAAIEAHATVPPPAAAESQLLRRLDTDMTCLTQAGFDLGEVTEFEERQVAVLATKGNLVIAFVVGEDYPGKPPLVLTFGPQGPQRFDISEETWTPDRNLLEIAESLV